MNLDVLPYSTYTDHNRRPRRTADTPSVGGVTFFILLGMVFSMCLAACQGVTSDAAELSMRDESTQTHGPSPTSTTTIPTPTKTASPTKLACAQQPGTVLRGQIADPSLPRYFPFRIYLPACYNEDEGRPYPSLYALHGLAKDDSQWDMLGIDETADRMIANGASPPFIIVMPLHATGIDIETALVDVLVPYIDEHYHTNMDPDFRSIGGLSRGGGLALRIGLKNPDVFHSIGLHSPANVSSLPYLTNWVDQIPEEVQMHVWIDIGDRDPLLESTQLLITWLEELGLDPLTSINIGFHDSNYWTQHIESYLTWYIGTWPSGN